MKLSIISVVLFFFPIWLKLPRDVDGAASGGSFVCISM